MAAVIGQQLSEFLMQLLIGVAFVAVYSVLFFRRHTGGEGNNSLEKYPSSGKNSSKNSKNSKNSNNMDRLTTNV